MSLQTSRPVDAPSNPIDILEEIVRANDWLYERTADDDMVVQIAGCWCEYRLFFTWQTDLGALAVSCAFDARVPDARGGEINDLLAAINESMWLGHFAVYAHERLPMFRHTIPMRGVRGASVEQLEDLVDIAVKECDRFFPAFQLVLWGGKTAAEAMAAAMPEPAGEA
ncbi:MAG: YbjN domain-containing protein [Kiloniellales bacterium]